MHSDALDKLLEQIQCPVCLDTLINPRTLGCGHTFCQNCVAELWQATAEDDMPKCPQCRTKFESYGKRNYALESIVAMLKSDSSIQKSGKRNSCGIYTEVPETEAGKSGTRNRVKTGEKHNREAHTKRRYVHNRTLRNSYTFGLFQEYETEAIRNSYTFGLADKLQSTQPPTK